MSRYDSQFCIIGDSALESPTAAKIDDWNPVSITQLVVYPLRNSTSQAFPNDAYAVLGTQVTIDSRFQNPAQIISGIPTGWPFARIGIRMRGYFELCPPVPNQTKYPQIMSEPIRLIIPSSRFDLTNAPAGWDSDDDHEPINYGGPGPVEIFDRVAFYSATPFSLRSVATDSPYIFGVVSNQRFRNPNWPQSPWTQYGGRLDPSNDPVIAGSETTSYFRRNISELNNLTNVDFRPGRIPNEQRVVITLYEPQRENEWRETNILELDPS